MKMFFVLIVVCHGMLVWIVVWEKDDLLLLKLDKEKDCQLCGNCG